MPLPIVRFYQEIKIDRSFNVLEGFQYDLLYRGCPRGVMVKAIDCGIVVSEFVFQSRY